MSVKRGKIAKVPVILQMEALECGAASLTMMLAYYRKWVPLEQVRKDCGVSRDGSNAANIAKAAAAYGLEVKARRYGVGLLRDLGKFPCIIWWNYNHFLVLDGFQKDKAVLNDPASGRVKVSMAEFEASYCGLCLQMQPGENFEEGGKPKSSLDFFRERLKGNEAAIVLVMLTSVLAVLAGVILPVFSRVYSDQILTGEHPQWITGFLSLFALMIAFQAIAQVFNAYSMLQAAGKMASVSNAKFLWHVLRMPMDFFAQRMAGDLANRQSENDTVSKTMVTQLAPTAINLILLIFYLTVMLRYSVPLTFVGVATVAANLGVAQLIARKRLEISRVQKREESKVYATTVSGVDMIETIKASGAENGFFERWSGFQASANRCKTEFSRVHQFLGPLPALIQQISSVIVLSLGAWLMIQGHMTAGVFLAFQSLLSSFLKPVNSLLAAGQSIQEMTSSRERIDDVLKYPAEIQEDDDNSNVDRLQDAQKLTGAVELKDVTFGYSMLAEPLIKDFSLSLKPGSRVALVGGSGSGKSTIAKMVSGLYKPWSGSITFDGKSISEIPHEIFTGSLSVVDQEVMLFADTIENNITMWDSTILDFEVILAARDAGLHDDILRRKGGYHHVLEEGGRNLSGGQRQRMEIARVLAGDPSIIIMDEATSALDAKTEFEVSEAIRKRGITCIIVAHRLSTIRDCDEIIVLDRGRVMERGTHETLMANGGLYSRLVMTE